MTCQSSKERQDLAEGAKQHNLDDRDGFDDDNHGLDDDYHDIGDDDGDVDHRFGQGGRSCAGARVAPAEKFGLGRKF